MKPISLEQARQEVERHRRIAKSAMQQREEHLARAASAEDKTLRAMWEDMAASELRVAYVINEDCDRMLAKLVVPNG
jgi:hypothetical protein